MSGMKVLLVAEEPAEKPHSLMATLPAGKAVKASSLLKKFATHFGLDQTALELRTARGAALGARDVITRDPNAAQTVLTVTRRAATACCPGWTTPSSRTASRA